MNVRCVCVCVLNEELNIGCWILLKDPKVVLFNLFSVLFWVFRGIVADYKLVPAVTLSLTGSV